MLIILIGIAAFVLLMLGVSGAFALPGKRQDNTPVLKLRQLLQARAQGKIDQEQFEREQAAIHLSILADGNVPSQTRQLRWIVPAISVAAAFALYLAAGKPDLSVNVPSQETVAPPQSQRPVPTTDAALAPMTSNNGGDLNALTKRLEGKLEKNPNNGEGWLLLARSYSELRQPKQAADAYAKAAALLAPDATLLADWVDARVMANNRQWDAESRSILKRALAADPKNIKALALSGSEAFERGDYQAAIGYWKQLTAAAAPDSAEAKLAEQNIQEANKHLSGKNSAGKIAGQSGLSAIGKH
ncbi:cytochrome c-type biogenesis protein CcmH [Oxalobacteraceae bacterium GrIS 2.11]